MRKHVMLAWWVEYFDLMYIMAFRLWHPARVCFGDFIAKVTHENGYIPDPDKYMLWQGDWMTAYLIITWCLFHFIGLSFFLCRTEKYQRFGCQMVKT